MNIIHSFKNILINKTIRNGALFSLFSFINRGFSFLLMMILAGFLTPSEYGYLSLFGTVVLLVSYVIALSTDSYLSVIYFSEGRKGVQNYFSSISFTIVISCITCLAILLLFGNKISNLVDIPLNSLYLVIVICAFTVYANSCLDLYRVKERIKTYGLLSCSNAFLNLILSVLLIAGFSTGWIGRVYAQTLCSVLFGLVGIIIFVKQGYYCKIDFVYLKRMLLWGIPLIPHVATTFIKQGCDRFIINSNFGIEDVGMFSFALNMSNILLMVGTGFNQSISVDIFKVLSNDSLSGNSKQTILLDRNRKMVLVYLISGVLLLGVIYFITPYLLPKYTESINYMPLLIINAFLGCVTLLYSSYLYYYSKTKYIMYTTFICAVLHLLLSYLLTRFSLYYTCIVYCISQGLIMCIIVKLALKVVRENITQK